jgi:hypothetical protein
VKARQWLDEVYDGDGLQVFDGLDEAILGVVERHGMDLVVLYDREKCVRIFMKRDGMTREDAEEYLAHNVTGAWIGARTPAFCTLAPK